MPEIAGGDFLEDLHSEWDLTDTVPKAAQKVWTSAKSFIPAPGVKPIEFCSLWGDIIRRDQAGLAAPSALIARALNQNLVAPVVEGVTREASLGPAKFPPAACCWRGGGFGVVGVEDASVVSPVSLWRFFVVGKHYRTTQFLATSFSEATADQFIRQAHRGDSSRELVKWMVTCACGVSAKLLRLTKQLT